MAKDESISVKEAVHKLQLSLLEGIRHEDQLFAAGSLISRSDYQDVVTERSITKTCGYPLCNNSLSSERPRKGRYRISLKEHTVYDLQETYSYCSSACLVNSRAFAESLESERCSVANSRKINEILNLFGDLSLDDQDLGEKGGLGFSDLKIEEKLDVKMGQMSLEDWVGPSNAIEGYVPVIDRSSKPPPSRRRGKESKTKSAKPKTDKGKVASDLDFTSTIIIGDQLSVPESDPKLKGYMSRLEELTEDQFINLESSSLRVGSGSELSSLAVESQFGIPVMLYDSAEAVSDKDVKESNEGEFVEKDAESNDGGLKSSLKSSGEKRLTRSVTWADETRKTGSTCNGELCEFQSVTPKASKSLSSSIRKLGAGSVVTPKAAETSSSSIGEDGAGLVRLASAEACALALSEAAEAVVSGEADVTDAVTEAGIVILPQPHDADRYSQKDEDMMDEDTTDKDLVALRWPKKPGVLNSELFSTEDSWYDPPPEGFSLALSPFSTMYMALFGWITSSSLAYIYGQDEHSHEEFLFVNGREYPRKIVLNDGRSSEIKLSMAGCLGRALPKVATDLRLKTPIFTIEKEVVLVCWMPLKLNELEIGGSSYELCSMPNGRIVMFYLEDESPQNLQGLTSPTTSRKGHLLNTMSFMDAIPSFKLKQWHVIALLFMDALSVCRIPGLTPHMTSGRKMLQKVLDGAHVSGDEYEIMKDLFIPLGRVPQFSAQSGA